MPKLMPTIKASALVTENPNKLICLTTKILATTKRSEIYAISASLPNFANKIVLRLIKQMCDAKIISFIMIIEYPIQV